MWTVKIYVDAFIFLPYICKHIDDKNQWKIIYAYMWVHNMGICKYSMVWVLYVSAGIYNRKDFSAYINLTYKIKIPSILCSCECVVVPTLQMMES